MMSALVCRHSWSSLAVLSVIPTVIPTMSCCWCLSALPYPAAAAAAAGALCCQVSFPHPLYPLVSPDVLVESFEVGRHISHYITAQEGSNPYRVRLAELGSGTMLQVSSSSSRFWFCLWV